MEKVTIERRSNHEHITGSEFKEEYNPELEMNDLKGDIKEAIFEFEEFHNLNGLELEEDDQAMVNDLKEFEQGDYDLNVGDFSYYITIA
ncbi:hypothetical protein [Aquibacillus saliphilus]|uniref:hypothetical protein n=1 Tax=Aquibacillus saliphilus TaxID=1909422 RepID=UPI001CEFE3E9|nr:hypothetical protein [Aquibacillus saliphilus]